MDPKKLLFLLSVLLPFFIAACDTTESDNVEKPVYDYVFLNIGDCRQVQGDYDGSKFYETMEVTGKTKRSDSLEVYTVKVTSQLYGAIFNEYYFIRDGYYYYTELDSTFTSESLYGQPYGEQKLAKVSPAEGDTWHRYPKDTASFSVRFQNTKSTLAGEFSNVCAFYLSPQNMTIYYAANYGYIGTSRDSVDTYTATYVKSGTSEIGELVPIDATSFYQMNKNDMRGIRHSPFGFPTN
jgi:hypothetical protein